MPPAPFILGAGRSGTTLLRLMLDAHPCLAIPAETGIVTLGYEQPPTLPTERFLAAVCALPTWADLATAPEDVAADWAETVRAARQRHVTPARQPWRRGAPAGRSR